ncbi:MAG: Rid family hydrolase [Bacteroidaceae bacterium]|nr:Rid family hydrolase [Bacteroidaceae bacterium]
MKDIGESHHILSISNPMLPYDRQLDMIIGRINDIGHPVFIRFFLSDPATQAPLLQERICWNCPVSVIGQTPLNGTKIAAWVWSDTGAVISRENGLFRVESHGEVSYWYAGGLSDEVGSHDQTVSLLDRFSSSLEEVGLSLEDNCVRTWFFVRDIDVNYKGMVEGRNSVFDRHNLTEETHFIASTGIEGRTASHGNLVMMDAVAVKGLPIRHIYGLSHLNRTSEYGVRFERGSVAGRHVFISGTASIDNRGQILHAGNVTLQTARMLENVRVLLEEAGSSMDGICCMLVYLRDPADSAAVTAIFRERFPDKPWIVLQAPVCRPGWLVEMECIATGRSF